MRKPSIKKLSQCFDDPKTARRIFEMPRAELWKLPIVSGWYSDNFHPPKTYQLRMCALNSAGGFHGVESIETAAGDEWAEYLNTGEMYAPTVIRWRGNYRVQDVGSFVESARVQFK